MDDNQSMASKIGSGAIYLTAGSLIGYVVSFLYKIITARYLGPEDFGVLSLVFVYIGIFTTFLSLGYGHALYKFIPELKAQRKSYEKYFSNAFWIILGVSIVTTLFSMTFAGIVTTKVFNAPQYESIFFISSFSIFFAFMLSFIGAAVGGLQKFKEISIGSVMEKIIRFFLTLGLLYAGASLIGVVWAILIATAITTVYYFYVYFSSQGISNLRDFRKNIFHKIDFTIQKKLLWFGIPIYLGAIGSTATGWLDGIMITYFLTVKDVGFYNAALPIMGILGSLIASISMGLFPMFSQLNALKERQKTTNLLNRALKYTGYLMIPAAFGLWIMSPAIINFFYTSEYGPASSVLKIIGFATIFFTLNMIINSYITGIGKSKIFMYISFLSIATQVLLNIILIPIYGIDGAAVTVLITLAFGTIISFVYASRHVKLEYSHYLRSFIASIIMFVLISPINEINLQFRYKAPLIMFSGILVYFVVLILLKGFDKADVRIFKESFEKFYKA